jgi:FkbM family methyltransferase
MRSKIREGLRVLSEEGPTSFLREVLPYVYQTVYWTVQDSYTLAIADTEVSVTAPNRTVVQRNKRRFSSEQNELIDLLEEIESDDVFFDIGANTGLYTLFAAKRRSAARVVSFEPYPPNVRLLKRDAERNELLNVDVRSEALSDSAGTVEFDQPEQEDAGYGSGSIEIDSGDSDSTVKVPAKNGDELIANDEVPTPNLIKIDVEGAEPLVIEGLESALSNPDCRLVYCEIHRGDVEYRPSIGDFGMTLTDMKTRFEEFGFEVEELQSRGTEVLLKMHK